MANTYVSYPAEGGGGGVSSLNSLTGALSLVAGSGITITPSGGDTLTIAASGGGGSPGGDDTAVQFNDSGSFGGSPLFRWDGSHVLLGDNAGGLAILNVRSQNFDQIFVQHGGSFQGYLIGTGAEDSTFKIHDYTNGRNILVAENGLNNNSIYIHNDGNMDINNNVNFQNHEISNWSDISAVSNGTANSIITSTVISGVINSNDLNIATGGTIDTATGDSGALSLTTGATELGSATGTIDIVTGDNDNSTDNSLTGDLNLTTGNNSGTGDNCISGIIRLTTGNNAGATNAISGAIILTTGDSSNQTGDIRLNTGNGTELDALSGSIILLTGSPDGDGDSGNIRLETSIPGGAGTQGYVSLIGLFLRLPKQSADPSGAAEGDCYWNTTSHALKVYNGVTWQTVTAV